MMERLAKYFTLEADHKAQVIFLMIISSFVYLFNFHVNDIWTPNESFYAEAVREMFESGNWMEFFYNYEPRYKKPPLTYWAIAASASVFGINEFGIRLPIVLMGIGSIWFTYLTGRRMYGNQGGIYAMVMMAFSLQLLAVKQYASPEMPLTFFFTVTMYYFIKGYLDNNSRSIYLSYVFLGLTVLTKGFPYFIIIVGIIGLFVFLNGPLKWQRVWSEIKLLRPHLGILVSLLIGLSWIIFMYLKNGQEFWEVYYRETFGRALSKKNNGPQPLFYIEVISWSILPYSLAFFFVLIKWVKDRSQFKKVLFPFCWFIVMLVIFTSSKGKLPTYIIQAHPALLLMIVPALLSYNPQKLLWKGLWSFVFLFPAVLILAATVFFIYTADLHWVFYVLPSMCLLLLAYFHLVKQEYKNNLLVAGPFWTMLSFLICFGAFLPSLEQFRPYDQIGEALLSHEEVDPKTPILIENTLIHNIPFYTQRHAEGYLETQTIENNQGATLALVKSKNFDQLTGFKKLWTGQLYDFPSESQFFKFIMASIEAQKGDLSKFAEYYLVYRP